MMRKFATIALITAFMATAAHAVPAEMTLFPEHSSTEINSFTSFELELENTGTTEDVYRLSSEQRQVTIAPTKVEIASGESETVNIWYNPDERMDAGEHSFTVTSEARSSGQEASITGTVDVIKDHDVSISATSSQLVCLNQEAGYDVEVTNDGIQSEEFQINTDRGQVSDSRVDLEPGETKTVTVTTGSSTPVNDQFEIIATAVTSYAQDTTEVSLTVENCYDSNMEIEPAEQEVAATTEAEVDVTLENLGTRQDTFELSTNLGTLEDEEITVNPGQTVETTMSYTPQQVEENSFTITAEGNSQSSASGTLNSYNGMNMETGFIETEKSVCEQGTATFEVGVENTGEAPETFQISTNRGELGTQELQLGTGETGTAPVEIDASNLEEGNVYTVEAEVSAKTFGEPSKTVEGQLEVENCWDVQLNVVPEVASAGENRSTVYEIQVDNPGTRENTYELTREGPEWTEISPEEVTVAPGETGTSYMYAGAPFEKKGDVKITVISKGTQASDQMTVDLLIDKKLEEAILSEEERRNGITGKFVSSVTGGMDRITGNSFLVTLLISIAVAVAVTSVILIRK